MMTDDPLHDAYFSWALKATVQALSAGFRSHPVDRPRSRLRAHRHAWDWTLCPDPHWHKNRRWPMVGCGNDWKEY
jgi:hypothetical protein